MYNLFKVYNKTPKVSYQRRPVALIGNFKGKFKTQSNIYDGAYNIQQQKSFIIDAL